MLPHIVPQQYLRGFETHAGSRLIWQFDKTKGAWSRTPLPIKAVATRTNRHSAEDEAKLNREIEEPANRHLKEVLKTRIVPAEARRALAAYMVVQTGRTDHWRNFVDGKAPEYWEKAIWDERRKLREEGWGTLTPIFDAMANARRNREGPTMAEDLQRPFTMLRQAKHFESMRWEVLKNERGDFLTCDNPVVVEAKEGLTSADALVLWPISRTMAVILSRDDDKWKKPPRRVRGGLASRANKFVASNADRFVFSPKPAEWLPKWWRRDPTLRWSDWNR